MIHKVALEPLNHEALARVVSSMGVSKRSLEDERKPVLSFHPRKQKFCFLGFFFILRYIFPFAINFILFLIIFFNFRNKITLY